MGTCTCAKFTKFVYTFVQKKKSSPFSLRQSTSWANPSPRKDLKVVQSAISPMCCSIAGSAALVVVYIRVEVTESVPSVYVSVSTLPAKPFDIWTRNLTWWSAWTISRLSVMVKVIGQGHQVTKCDFRAIFLI